MTESRSVQASLIPLIDIAPFFSGDAAARERVAAEVRDACESIGFLVIKGHGVPTVVVDALYREARAFFDLPLEEKLRIEKPHGTNYKGFTPQGTKTVGKDRNAKLKPSLNESFAIGPLHVTDDPYYLAPEAGTNFAPNMWPDRPAALRPAMVAYYHEMERLAAGILSIFAQALGVPDAYFASRMNRHCSILRTLHYPNLNAAPGEGEERAAAHTDTTAITILKIDDAPGGLQVQMGDGSWVDIIKTPDTFIINIGDIMMRWTNDRYLSTMHRVANPPATVASVARRISIPYFCMPNYDALIECVPSCAGSGAKYAPITSGKLLANRYATTYSLKDAAPA